VGQPAWLLKMLSFMELTGLIASRLRLEAITIAKQASSLTTSPGHFEEDTVGGAKKKRFAEGALLKRRLRL
jgi:hypothetical protein